MFCLLLANFVFSQKLTITGTVTSETNGETLPGVSVLVKELSGVGTITDFDGKYTIEAEETQTLVFSYIGMVSKEVAVKNQAVINVKLSENVENLSEVVVVGYGTSSKKLLTGSVGAIGAEKFEKMPMNSIDGVMQGQTAGVQISQNSGTPGGGMTVRVRGISSINAGSQPLYVIDGIPVTTGNFGQVGFSGQGINAISDLNPNDIESISILRDASSAAIYGARASNGVVLITTKSGKANKTKINFSAYYGVQQAANKLKLMNAQEWNEFQAQMAGNDPSTAPAAEHNTDWLNEVFRTAPIANYELSAQGGNEKTSFFVSGSYFTQEGILLGTDFQRLSGRLNLDHKINDYVKFKTGLSISRSENNRVEGDQSLNGPLPNAITLPAIYPVYNADGTYNESGPYANPIAIAKEAVNTTYSFRNIGNIGAEIKLLPGLRFETKLGVDYLSLNEHSFDPPTTRQGARSNGIGIEAATNVTNVTANNILTYSKTFAGIHDLDFLFGNSIEQFNRKSSFLRGTDFPNEYFEYLANAGTVTAGTASNTLRSTNSFFGRAKYNLNNKYLFEALARYDGSSKFGENNRYGLFPAFSVAWRVSEEAFFPEAIDDFKLRLGYGITGNDQIGDFRSIGLYGSANYSGTSGLAPIQLPDPDLKWETTKQLSAGFDLSFISNRITINFDFYNKLTYDMLLDRPLPTSSGFSTITTNIGEMKNTGYEIGLTTENVKTDNFLWTSNFNISTNKNEVTKLYKGQPIGPTGRGSNRIEEGEEIGYFYGYESLGVDPTTGDIVFRDIDNNGVINDKDQTKIGSPHPDFNGGFNNTVSYKGFELNLFLQYTYGNDVFNGTRIYTESCGETPDNQTTDVIDRWQKPGDIAEIPRATASDPNNNNRPSSRFIEDGSFLRIKTLSLTYNFNSNMLSKLKLYNLKVYCTMQNLYTFTQYSGMDPEVNYAGDTNYILGTDFFTYPQARTFIFGLNVGF